MSFNISYGDSIINPVFSKDLPVTGSHFNLTGIRNYFRFGLVVDSSLHLLDSTGTETFGIDQFSDKKIASFIIGNAQHLVGTSGNLLNDFITDGNTQFYSSTDAGEIITTVPVIRYLPNPQILIGTSVGRILMYNPGDLPATDPVLEDSISFGGDLSVQQVAADSNLIAAIFSSANRSVPFKGYQDNQGNSVQFKDEVPLSMALTKNRSGNYVAVVLTSEKNIYLISGSEILTKWNASSEITSFAIADLRQDGENYIVYNNGKYIEARNLSGALADNFPYKDPDGKNFTGNILAADFEGNNNSEIIASTEDGRIFAIDGGTGKTIYGFPISAGSDLAAVPVLYVQNGKISYAALNKQMNLSAWNIGLTEGTTFWGENYGNSVNSAFVKAASAQNQVTGFFPENRAYNYPNPVYGSQTFIRYYVSEDAKINIKIFDLAGDYVAELNDDAQGGMDNETVWNLGDIQSGIYLARIEATGISGKSESKIIKIAVVK